MSETWLDLARESRKVASTLVRDGYFRSAIARAYYAAFSKITYELLLAGEKMPADREGPTHKKLRPMVEANLRSLEKHDRVALSRIVGRLYTLRIAADYQPSTSVSAADAREAVSLMNKVFYAF